MNRAWSSVWVQLLYNFFFFLRAFLFHLTFIHHCTLRSMKTGFLKWRPDFDVAADEYQKAGLFEKEHFRKKLFFFN